MAIDPVCGMQVDEQQAQNSTHYEQHPYYFCSAECKTDFERDPRQYVNPDGSIIRRPGEPAQAGYMRGGDGVHTGGLSREQDSHESGPQRVPPQGAQRQSKSGSSEPSRTRQGAGGKQKKFGG